MVKKYVVTTRITDDEKQMIEEIKQYYANVENMELTTTDLIKKAIKDVYKQTIKK